MPVLSEIKIAFDLEKMVESFKGREFFDRMKGKRMEAAETALTLASPKAVYEWYQVEETDEDTLYLKSGEMNDVSLTIGKMVHLLSSAEQVLAGVVTIGNRLEERVNQLSRSKDTLYAYLLDTAGVYMLEQVSTTFRKVAEDESEKRSWGVSPSLSPGSLDGWDVTGQKELCAIIPIQEIGVSLTDSCLLLPYKSVSEIIGIGPGYTSKRVGASCKYCSHAKTCSYRKEKNFLYSTT